MCFQAKYFLTNSTGDGVATEGGEITPELVRDDLAADDGTHGVTVAQALPHRDDVRDEAVLHEGPHVVPRPAQPGLDLVSNDEASVLSDNPGASREVRMCYKAGREGGGLTCINVCSRTRGAQRSPG